MIAILKASEYKSPRYYEVLLLSKTRWGKILSTYNPVRSWLDIADNFPVLNNEATVYSTYKHCKR